MDKTQEFYRNWCLEHENTRHIYSSILLNKDLLIPPSIFRKIFQKKKKKRIGVDVLFPPFHEKQVFP